MNQEDYLRTLLAMHGGIIEDPLMRHHLTVAWLDPMAVLKGQDLLDAELLEDYYYSGDMVGEGLYVTRHCFPDIYAQVVSKLRNGSTIDEVMRFIDQKIEAQTNIPTTQFEEGHAYAYGIPMDWWGLAWDEPEFIDDHPDAWHLMQLFGATIDPDGTSRYHIDIEFPQYTLDAAYILYHSLEGSEDQTLHKAIRFAIGYVFSCTGNSSVDFTYEHGCEFQPLMWEPDAIEFAQAILTEAQEIMTAAHEGLQAVYHPHTQTYLGEKIDEARQHVHQQTKKGIKIHDLITEAIPNPFQIQWDGLHRGTPAGSESDPDELQDRLGAA